MCPIPGLLMCPIPGPLLCHIPGPLLCPIPGPLLLPKPDPLLCPIPGPLSEEVNQWFAGCCVSSGRSSQRLAQRGVDDVDAPLLSK